MSSRKMDGSTQLNLLRLLFIWALLLHESSSGFPGCRMEHFKAALGRVCTVYIKREAPETTKPPEEDPSYNSFAEIESYLKKWYSENEPEISDFTQLPSYTQRKNIDYDLAQYPSHGRRKNIDYYPFSVSLMSIEYSNPAGPQQQLNTQAGGSSQGESSSRSAASSPPLNSGPDYQIFYPYPYQPSQGGYYKSKGLQLSGSSFQNRNSYDPIQQFLQNPPLYDEPVQRWTRSPGLQTLVDKCCRSECTPMDFIPYAEQHRLCN